ncbi:iron export ABC transporter permease subunit FetB [bacterium]|nr:iron export ABC transporter permease subunit FetB [bacterium]
MILLSPVDLTIAASLILILALIAWFIGVGLHRQILFAALRTTVQLLLLGFVLKILFDLSNPLLILAMTVFMLLVGGREIFARQKKTFRGVWGFGIGTSSMFISSFTVTLFTLIVVINVHPWYAPQYLIPLLGMILGNTMNGISIALDNLTRTAWDQREMIEQRLLLGFDKKAAILLIKKESTRAGLIPLINSMSTAGIVSLPGMMTGQILAGSPPIEAVKYQILIMFMIASGTGFGIITALWIASNRLFDDRDRLRLDRLISRE